MKESGAVLIRRYAFDPAAHRAYIDKILKRFANPYLHDDIDRVARQPLRKLGAQERFIKPLNGMLEYDLPHDATVRAIAATLHYHNPDDPQAVEMQYYRQAHGIAATLAKYSDFTHPAVVAEIEAAYQALYSGFHKQKISTHAVDIFSPERMRKNTKKDLPATKKSL